MTFLASSIRWQHSNPGAPFVSGSIQYTHTRPAAAMLEYSQKAPDPPRRRVSVRNVWETTALATQLLVAAAPLAKPLTCGTRRVHHGIARDQKKCSDFAAHSQMTETGNEY